MESIYTEVHSERGFEYYIFEFKILQNSENENRVLSFGIAL